MYTEDNQGAADSRQRNRKVLLYTEGTVTSEKEPRTYGNIREKCTLLVRQRKEI